MSLPEESVLVIPRSLFVKMGHFQGFCSQIDQYRDQLLSPEHVRFMKRSEAEQNPEFKQLIPYMIFSWTDQTGQVSLFRYVRGKGQGESRLHHKQSIGIGGHISLDDVQGAKEGDYYKEGMNRELQEEVRLFSPYTEKCVGLINDDETEVGRVHLGIVHRFELVEPNMQPNEPDIIESGFQPVAELLSDLSRFETWSAICLNALFAAK
ncbi:MAG: phosphoesterase [Thermoguttaceae bacterium]